MAISIMTVFLGMLAGISLLAFINHFFISLRLQWNRLHLRFSAVCLTAMVYTLCTMLEYQTTSIDSYFNLLRVQMFAVSFFMTATILFTATYTGGVVKKPAAVFIALVNLFMIARLFHPTTLTFTDPRGMKPYTLPWNETLWLADADASFWGASYYVMLLGFLFIVFSLLRSQYRAGKREESGAMFLAMLMLLLSAANDVIVVSFGLQWIYLGDLGYVGLVAVMSARLSSDVARLTETEQKIRVLEVQRQAIFNSMSHFTGLLDSEGRLLDANEAALEFVGRSIEEVRGLPFRDAPWWRGLPEEQGKLDDAMARALKGEMVRFETRHTDSRGERLVIDFSLTPLVNEHGAVTHLVPEGRDITEMHVAREEIRRHNTRLELANQEINTTNEELEATNEEFEAQNEELMRSQEELRNSEMMHRLLSAYSERLNDIFISFNEAGTIHDLFTTIAESIRGMTGAIAAASSRYDPASKTLIVAAMAGDDGLIEKLNSLLGAPVISLKMTVPDEIVRTMTRQVLIRLDSLETATFGYIPDSESRELMERFGCTGITVLALHYGDELFGTTTAFMPRELPEVPDHVLASFAYMAALAITKKNSDEALRAGEEKYRELVENITEVVYATDQDGNFTYLSPSIERITAYRPDELIGADSYSFIHPEDRGAVEEDSKALRKGVIKPSEYRVRTKSGDYRWILSTSRPIIKNGRYMGSNGVFTDITKRRLAEDRLLREKTFISTVLDALPGIFFMLDEDGGFIRWRNQQADALGYRSEDVWTMNALDFVPEEERESIRSAMGKALDEGSGGSEVTVRAKNGELHYYYLNASRMVIEEKRYLLCVGIDISDRKKAENELLEEKALIETVLDTMPGLFFMIDEHGNMVRWHPGRQMKLGFTDMETRDMRIVDFLGDRDREQIADKILQVLHEGSTSAEVELKVKDGIDIPYYIEASLLNLKDRPYIVGIGMDMTESKKAEQEKERAQNQLVRAQKMEAVGTLAGGIAHDFNNMLGGIMGSLNLVELLLENDAGPNRETILNYIETALESSRRAADMTKQLLTLSRKSELKLAPVDVNLSLKHVMKLCRNSFPKTVDLEFTAGEAPLRMQADPVQVEQVLLNLCVNASHAMTLMRPEEDIEGGILTVSAAEMRCESGLCALHPEAIAGDPYIAVRIGDTGVGMDEETRRHIFDPFYTTKKREEGTGLGLAIAYSIVKQHGGFIDVHSEPGKGSTFTLYFPSLVDQASSASLREGKTRFVPGTGTILVIDDERSMLLIARGMLEQCGYRVLSAAGGVEGLDLYSRGHESIEGVLLDLSMPVMSGLEILKKMKEINPGVKALIASGHIDDQASMKAQMLGVRAILQKPYTIAELSAKIKETLG